MAFHRGLIRIQTTMDPDSFHEAIELQTRGEYGGLGIEPTKGSDGLLKVVAPIDDTPAAKAGVMATRRWSLSLPTEQAHGLRRSTRQPEKMRGPVNTKIKLTIARKGRDKRS